MRRLFEGIFRRKVPNEDFASKDVLRQCFELLYLPHQANFSVRCDVSSIPDSDDGVYLQGYVKEGTVVALYPGTYYPPLPLHCVGAPDGSCAFAANEMRHKWDNNVYMINLPTIGGYIDGKDVDFLQPKGGNLNRISHNPSPFAVGQVINHPAMGTAPNTTVVDFIWRDALEIGESLYPDAFTSTDISLLVPNRLGSGPWFIDPVTNDVVMINESDGPPCPLAGVAVVAISDISDGCELFFDYKLAPKDRPDWYSEPVSTT